MSSENFDEAPHTGAEYERTRTPDKAEKLKRAGHPPRRTRGTIFRVNELKMSAGKEEHLQRARADLAKRLGLSEDEITEEAVEETDFPDAALGAPLNDEMSAQMITSGWRIRLKAGSSGGYEYRANQNQLRLYNFKGSNYKV